MNLKQIDYKRTENRAEFQIRQRDNYIHQLKEQLEIRDQLIKDKLGSSITNFLQAEELKGKGVFSSKDIDNMQNDFVLPSLKVAKANNFVDEMLTASLQKGSQAI